MTPDPNSTYRIVQKALVTGAVNPEKKIHIPNRPAIRTTKSPPPARNKP